MALINDQAVINCTCQSNSDPHRMCDGQYRLNDQGVKVDLNPKAGETVQLVIMDGCFCTNQGKKCDALYLFMRQQDKRMISVELKGTHVEEGVEQLSETVRRTEYKRLKSAFDQVQPVRRIREQAFLVTYQPVGAANRKRLSNTWGISFTSLVTTKGSGKIKDIRNYL